MERTISTREDLQTFAHEFVSTLIPNITSATLVTLSGELGAGKTAFTQDVAKAFGIEDHITSPTFVLEKIYALPEGSTFACLVHIDAYRLSGVADLAPLGFDELMQNPENLIMLEWPERIGEGLPHAAHMLSLVVHDDGTRTISHG